MYAFSFTGDSSGAADNIQLPQDFPAGKKLVLVRPPAGHAWTAYGPTGATGYPLDPDREFPFKREPEQAPFVAGEVIGRVALDSGSGTFYGCAP